MRVPITAFNIGETVFWLSRLTTSPLMNARSLRRHQLRRLRAVLAHVRRNYPFYRRRMDENGVNPDLPGGFEEFRRLPVLEREEYRDFVDAPEWEEKRRSSAAMDRTSGSTGRPITIYRSSGECARVAARFFRALFANGYNIRDKTFQICLPGEETVRNGRFLKMGLLGGMSVCCVQSIDAWIDAYLRFRPDIVYSYRVHLIQIALHAAEKGIPFPRPKLVVSYGEYLDPASRNLLFETFGGAPVIQTYGTTEFGTIGYQTKDSPSFRLYNQLNHFELENGPAGEGAGGSLIVTDLYPGCFPLIRYRLGDRVLFGMEEGVPILRSFAGRENDFIRLGDGSIYGSDVFAMIMERRLDILQFRIIQSAPEELDIYYVARKDSDAGGHERGIVADIEREVSSSLKIRMMRLPRIDPEPNGKLRCVIRRWEEI